MLLSIQQLASLLSSGTRLITITGAGGLGKTRLSQRLAVQQLEQFSGGAWFCDLTEVRTPAGIRGAIAQALSIPLTEQHPERQLTDALQGRGRLLLVLDNFEQLVSSSAQVVAAWRKAAPKARFLVTSQALLNLPGERVYELAPLQEDAAVALFVDRARELRSGKMAIRLQIMPVSDELVLDRASARHDRRKRLFARLLLGTTRLEDRLVVELERLHAPPPAAPSCCRI